MNDLLKKYLRGDTVIWIVFIALCLISVVEMYSASSSLAYRADNYTAPIFRHAMFLGIGALIVFGVHLIPYKYFRMFNYLLLILSVALLIFTLFRGVSAADAKRWVDLGFFQLQPSELAKISVIIFIADLLARKQQKDKTADSAFYPVVGVLAFFCMLIVSENFSTAFLLFVVGIAMMFIGRVSMKKLLQLGAVLFIVIGVAFFVGWHVKRDALPGMLDRLPTQVNRVKAFLGEDGESKFVRTDENMQVWNSQIAIAKGGILPQMPGSSEQRDYLPEAYSDFIFAIVLEELGFLIGGILVISLYLILLYRAGYITYKSTQTFPALLVIGLTLMLVLQAFVSMGVATHLIPVTGQPLPLISRGGTSILITCVYFGIILSVTRSLKEGNIEKEKT